MNSLASQYPAFKVPRALGLALGANGYVTRRAGPRQWKVSDRGKFLSIRRTT